MKAPLLKLLARTCDTGAHIALLLLQKLAPSENWMRNLKDEPLLYDGVSKADPQGADVERDQVNCHEGFRRQ